MKKIATILAAIILLLAGGYLFIRYQLLRAKDFKPDLTRSRSVLDLRPALIARLRQMMKDGTKGLYRLTIEDIEPDIANASVDLVGVNITVDSTVLTQLDKLKQAPDDVFHIAFDKLRIEGLGLAELVNRKQIDLEKISVSYPEMQLARTERTYNAQERQEKDTLTLYQRLTKHVSHISVKSILVDHGAFTSRNLSHKSRDTRLENVSIHMNDLLIDSSTQHDRSRFFFSSNTFISLGRLHRPTADSLYNFTADSVFLEAKEHRLTAFRVSLMPRGNRQWFQRQNPYRNDRFEIAVPKLVFRKMNWWRLFNKGSIDCEELVIPGGHFNDYINDSLPAKPVKNLRNFPYQVLHDIPLPLNIQQVTIRNFDLVYTEHNHLSGQNGTIYFDNINARILNLINKPAYIKPGMWCRVNAHALFMRKQPIQVQMNFDMNRYKTGNFTASIQLGETDPLLTNPVTAPLGFFVVKKGMIDKASATLKGDNASVYARLELLYHDLHISILEKKKQQKGELNKKHVLGFIANAFVIKNSNSHEKGEARIPEVNVVRDGSNSFFNFCWRALRLAVMKAAGIPEKFAPH